MKRKRLIGYAAAVCLLTQTVLTAMPVQAAEKQAVLAIITDENTETTFDDFESGWTSILKQADASKDEVHVELRTDWIASENGFGSQSPAFENGMICLHDNQKIKLDLSGHIIDRKRTSFIDDGGIFYLHDSSSLSIVDSCPDAVHSDSDLHGGILRGGASGDTGGAIHVSDSASLQLSDISIVGCMSQYHGGAIAAFTENSITLQNVGFYTNITRDSFDPCYGGAIYLDNGADAYITHCAFEGNDSEDSGGALFIEEGSADIRDCSFYGNHATDNGGAIYAASDTEAFNLSQTLLLDNHADDYGGAFYTDTDCDIRVAENTFTRNECGESGGAIYVNDGLTVLVGGSISANSADGYGGGVYVNSRTDVGVQGDLVIQENLANGQKSNLCLQDGIASTARIINGGLYEGASIYLSTTSGGEVRTAKDISMIQAMSFLHADNGSLNSKNTYQKAEKFFGSVIGNGNLIFVIAASLSLLLLAGIIFIIVKRRGKHEKS